MQTTAARASPGQAARRTEAAAGELLEELRDRQDPYGRWRFDPGALTPDRALRTRSDAIVDEQELMAMVKELNRVRAGEGEEMFQLTDLQALSADDFFQTAGIGTLSM